MRSDPIVDEVRAARQKIFDACGGDLNKLLDRLKEAEAQHKDRIVSVTPPSGSRSRHRKPGKDSPDRDD